MDQRFQKWEKWLETIREEVMDLVRSRHIFWKLGNVVKNNQDLRNFEHRPRLEREIV